MYRSPFPYDMYAEMDGVLHISIQRRETSLPRRISVQ